MTTRNNYNYLTAKERNSLSFPAKVLLNRDLLIGEILDFGCGFGKDVEDLKLKGFSIVGYDKHYFPVYPKSTFDTIICFYVLNVLTQEEQAAVLMEVSQLLKPDGRAYFAVRRDIRYEGFRIHKIHNKPTFQCNVILPYHSLFKNENCEIYEYRHYNQRPRGGNGGCLFCYPDTNRELIVESATAFAIYDKFPVSPGHALVIPKRHCANYFDLTFKEQSACWYMLNNVKSCVEKKHSPKGYNVGVNISATAGQTIPHAHIHLIPRYSNDVPNPRGGIRNIIPGMGDYIEL